jgi:peptide/nickel transport system permease protein
MFVVATIVFFMCQLNPVDPAAVALGIDASPEIIAAKRAELGTDRSAVSQYISWLSGSVRGDLGVSWSNGEAVTLLLSRRVPVTVSIVIGAVAFSVISGVALGVTAALNAGSWRDRAVTLFASLGLAVPNFWVAILLVYFFAVRLGWFPSIWTNSGTSTWSGWIHAMVLPCIALSTSASAAIARQSRSAMIGVLQRDYIRTAMAKGLSLRRIVLRHALRPAAIPIVTLVGFQVSALFGGAVLVEVVSSIPGLGSLGVDAVLRNDVPVVLGFVMVTTLVVVTINLLLDLSYAWLNPKVRTK